MKLCPERGLENARKTELVPEPAEELFGSINNTIEITSSAIINQILSNTMLYMF